MAAVRIATLRLRVEKHRRHTAVLRTSFLDYVTNRSYLDQNPADARARRQLRKIEKRLLGKTVTPTSE